MIKVNLAAKNNQLDISNVGGLDFTQLNFKAFLLSLVVLYAPDYTLYSHFDAELADYQNQQSELIKESNGLKGQLAKLAALERQIKDLKEQEENLQKKLLAVKEAINLKTTPVNLLLYIAKNIPETLWLKELTIQGKTMIIKGEALSYPAVGEFLNNVRSSVFIKDANIKSSGTVQKTDSKARHEAFEVHFEIARFE